METARKVFRDFFAITSMANANKPAQSVPNPRFSPLHKVAPDIHSETKGKLKPCKHTTGKMMN